MDRNDLPPPTGVGEGAFDAFYYAHCCGKPYIRNPEWLASFGAIAQRVVTDIAPRRVLDAGCAMGFLVETLRDRGVEAFGLDLSTYAIEHVHGPVKPFCRAGSITDDLGGDYDLIVTIEVMEHMPPRDAEAAIANICAHTSDVLFSSSPVDYREPTHVNVHPPEHWAEQFARHGFYRDVDYDATYILPWAVRFRRRVEPAHRLVREYERRFWELQREAADARSYSAEIQRKLAEAEPQVAELTQTRELLAKVEAERRGLSDTLFHMERSWFWKMRLAFVAIRKRLPGGRG
jgi:SAM-dependent methyltransferase